VDEAAEKRQAFLFGGLRRLDESLKQIGSGLIVRCGDPVVGLSRLLEEVGGGKIFAGADVPPYAMRRDQEVARRVDLNLVESSGVHPPETVRWSDGGIYTVYTPYRNAWISLPLNDYLIPVPVKMAPIPAPWVDPIPYLEEPEGFPLSEQAALR